MMSKGSTRRPTQVDEAEFQRRWEQTFNRKAALRRLRERMAAEEDERAKINGS